MEACSGFWHFFSGLCKNILINKNSVFFEGT